MATISAIGSNLVRFYGIAMLSGNLHEVTFNNGLTKQFWVLTNDVVMKVHTFDDCVSKKDFDGRK